MKSLVYLFISFISFLAFGQQWSADALQEALDAELPYWEGSPNVGAEYGTGVLHSGKAMYYLALYAYYHTDHPDVNATLRQMMLNVIAGGNEPTCRGVIAGWADNSLAHTITLAKHTPHIWEEFSSEEKEKFHWLMKAMTIAGNYCQNFNANVHRGLYQQYNWRKRWNPNHQEGYVGVMAAAHIYFGGTQEVNQMLAEFSYNEYMTKFDDFGFTNVQACWSEAGQDLMENGGTDAGGGTAVSVRTPFTYEKVLANPTGEEIAYSASNLYTALSERMYRHVTASGGCDGQAFIVSGLDTPVEGEVGMMHEFAHGDADGCRSDARYVVDGWVNNILTAGTLVAFGVLENDISVDLTNQIGTGIYDLEFKLLQGYSGRANGKTQRIFFESNMSALGYSFCQSIWFDFVKPSFTNLKGFPPLPPTGLSLLANGDEITLSWIDNSSDESSFQVYRGESPNTLSQIAELETNTTSYRDNTVKMSTKYYYRVLATNEHGIARTIDVSTRSKCPTCSVVRFFSDDDTYVQFGANSDVNYNGGTTLEVKRSNSSNFVREIFLKFNTSYLEDIESAFLRLHLLSETTTIQEIYLSNDENWSEEELTGENIPEATNKITEFQSESGEVLVDITEAVASAIENEKTVTLRITSQMDELSVYASQEHEEESYRPQLVVEKIPDVLVDFSISPARDTLYLDSTIQLIPNYYPVDADDRQVVWNSTNEEVATVNENGEVTGISEGQVTIRALGGDAQIEAFAQIEIANPLALSKRNRKPLVYPNPTSNRLFVSDIAKIKDLTLYSIEGKRTKLHLGLKLSYLDLSGLPAGIYLLKGFTAANRSFSEIIIKR